MHGANMKKRIHFQISNATSKLQAIQQVTGIRTTFSTFCSADVGGMFLQDTGTYLQTAQRDIPD
jgi:hypothetical protein